MRQEISSHFPCKSITLREQPAKLKESNNAQKNNPSNPSDHSDDDDIIGYKKRPASRLPIIEKKIENIEQQPKRRKLRKTGEEPLIQIPTVPVTRPAITNDEKPKQKTIEGLLAARPAPEPKKVEKPKQIVINPADFFAQNIKKLESKTPGKTPEPSSPKTQPLPMEDTTCNKADSTEKVKDDSKEIMEDILVEYKPVKVQESVIKENVPEKEQKVKESVLEKIKPKKELEVPSRIEAKLAPEPIALAPKRIQKSQAVPQKKVITERPTITPIVSTMWVDKYAPKTMSEVVGNSDVLASLKTWMKDWEDVVLKGNKKKVDFRKNMPRDAIPNPNAKACLLSGPPGIGKSTAARLVAKELGYEVLETNASDQRSKKVIEELLSDAVNNENIIFYTEHSGDVKKVKTKKVAIIMDEVDGVSGTNDRGGIAALIKIIENTKVPVICICNDRQNPKIRSLASHCFDLRFARPGGSSIRQRLQEILKKEGKSMDEGVLRVLVESSGNDIRQVINALQLQSRVGASLTPEESKKILAGSAKDQQIMLNPFEAATKLLNKKDAQNMKFEQKLNMFFIDYDMMPLLMQENYLTAQGQNRVTLEDMEKIADSADYISFGDCISQTLRGESAWELLPNLGVCSTVAPAALSAGYLYIAKFPQILGKNMTLKKTTRQVREIASAVAGKISVPSDSLLNDAIPQIFGEIVLRICTQDDGKLKEAIGVMDYFGISLDQFKENLMDLCANTKYAKQYTELPPAAKTAFTKLYNKTHQDAIKKGTKKGKTKENHMKDKVDPELEEMKDDEDSAMDNESIEEEEKPVATKKQKVNKKSKGGKKKPE